MTGFLYWRGSTDPVGNSKSEERNSKQIRIGQDLASVKDGVVDQACGAEKYGQGDQRGASDVVYSLQRAGINNVNIVDHSPRRRPDSLPNTGGQAPGIAF